MDAYTIVTLFRALVGHFDARTALGLVFAVAVFFALRGSASWFFSEVVRLLNNWVTSQTSQNQALLAQNREYAAQINTFLTNHLAHLKSEREEHRADMQARDATLSHMSASLTQIGGVLNETLGTVRAHREEDQRRAEAV